MDNLYQHLDPRTRASRTEYTISLICCFILYVFITRILPEIYRDLYADKDIISFVVGVILGIIFLIFIIRRLRDTALSWIWAFIMLLPYVNLLIILLLCFIPPDHFKEKQTASEPTSDPQPKSLPNSVEPESTPEPEPEPEPEPISLTDLEQSLINKYSALYQQYKNLSPEEATDLATTLIKEAKQETLQNHTYDLPTNLGSLVLQNTSPTDQYAKSAYDLIQRRLPRLRSEGVTDKDIKWWWNFSQIERSMIIKNDEMEYHNFFVTQLLKTQTQFPKKETAQNAAHALTNKRFPIYTQNLQDDAFSPDDPLPYELKERVDAFMANASRSPDFQQTLQQLQTFSTFNAFVRKQIQDKKL